MSSAGEPSECSTVQVEGAEDSQAVGQAWSCEEDLTRRTRKVGWVSVRTFQLPLALPPFLFCAVRRADVMFGVLRASVESSFTSLSFLPPHPEAMGNHGYPIFRVHYLCCDAIS